MKKLDLGQTIQIIANIGVIGGIIFLGVEIQQNNDELTSQARFNYYSNRLTEYRMVAQNPEMTDLVYRAGQGEPLTPQESLRLRNRMLSLITSWEFEFGEYQRGRLSPDEFNIPAKQYTVEIMPVFRQYWDEYRQFAPAEFRDFMDQEIVER